MDGIEPRRRTSAARAGGTALAWPRLLRRRISSIDRWLLGWIGAVIVVRTALIWLPLGIDEGGFAFVSRAALTAHDHGTRIYGSQFLDRPPLLVAVYGFSALVGGTAGVRLLGLVAAVATILGVARAASVTGGAKVRNIAVPIASVLICLPAIQADLTYSELLAAAPSVWAVALLLGIARANRIGRAGWVTAVTAGVLSGCALLFKQSFIEPFVVGVIVLSFTGAPRRHVDRAAAATAYALGAALPLAAVVVWAGLDAAGGIAALYEAVVGFRAQALQALSAENVDWWSRLARLAPSGAGAAMPALLPLAVIGLARAPVDRAMKVTLGAWGAVTIVAMLGGGSYWPHYWIATIPPVATLAAFGLESLTPRWRQAGVLAASVLVVAGIATMAQQGMLVRRYHREHQIARFVHEHARSGDTVAIVYAHANLAWYLDMPMPYPYQWTLMERTMADARPRLHAMLERESRPTWIVVWQSPGSYGLDPDGWTALDLDRNYRAGAHVCGKRVLIRRDDRRTLTPTNVPCAPV